MPDAITQLHLVLKVKTGMDGTALPLLHMYSWSGS